MSGGTQIRSVPFGCGTPATAVGAQIATVSAVLGRLLDLHTPAQIVQEDFEAVFGAVPGTVNPLAISCAKLDDLLMLASSHRTQQ